MDGLAERYPYQFKKPLYDVEQSMRTGWLCLFEVLCADIDRHLDGNPRGFYWSTLKVKIGTPRWYPCFTHALDENTRLALYGLIHLACAQTEKLCCACGCNGAEIVSEEQDDFCEMHRNEARANSDTFWDWVQLDTCCVKEH